MKKYSIAVLMLASSSLFGAETLYDAFAESTKEGYVRTALQYHDQEDKSIDKAIGGKLALETAPLHGISLGVGFYTTQKLASQSSEGVPFFDSEGNAYTILAEAYIKGLWGNSQLLIGRQAFDSPFADTDDIGMVPNTFEAVSFVNNDIQDTTITAAHLFQMAGVDAEVPEDFTRINGSDGVQVIGIGYEGIESVVLNGWYYHANELADLWYVDGEYSYQINDRWTLGAVGQYANQSFEAGSDVSIVGGMLLLSFETYGLTFYTAFNSADSDDGQAADNFLGGGPFLVNCEHMTMAEVGANGEAYRTGLEIDATKLGLNNLGFSISYFNAEGDNSRLNELDITASYALTDHLSFDLVYGDVEDELDDANSFTNTRAFVNYTF